MRRSIGHDAGLTLTELLIVILVLGVLSTVVLMSVDAVKDRGARAACNSDAKLVRTAVESYRARTGQYPDAGNSGMDQLTAVDERLLRRSPAPAEPGSYAIELGTQGAVDVTNSSGVNGGVGCP